jgi:hypothetical protein
MPYIGKLPTTGNFIKLDTISVVNGQAAYTMQKDSANFSPASANQMLVSLNGIIQNPGSSFTISGSTITFASNLVTGDVINYILVLGDVLNIGTPSDGTVTNAKTNFVSTSSAAGLQIKGDGTTDGTLQLNCSQNSHGVKIKSPNHSSAQSYTLTLPSTAPSADKILQSDGSGNLSFIDTPSSATVSEKASTTGTGAFSITSLTVNVPLFVVAESTGANKPECLFRVTAGTTSGGTTQNSNVKWFIGADDSTNANRTVPGFVLIPSATTVTITVDSIDGKLRAYQ